MTGQVPTATPAADLPAFVAVNAEGKKVVVASNGAVIDFHELLTKQEVAARLRCDAQTVMRLVRAGKFPKPIRYGDSDRYPCLWPASDVAAYVRDKIEARDLGVEVTKAPRPKATKPAGRPKKKGKR